MPSTRTTIFSALIIAIFFASCQAVYAQKASYNESYTIQGFSQPNRISHVASPTTGIVRSLEVVEGAQVKLGECLVTLDRRVHIEKLEMARVAKDSLGELQYAKAELAAKQTRLTRLKELANRQHATAIELLQAEEDVAIAETALVRAKDRLSQYEAEHNRLLAESDLYTINAPFDGVVVKFEKQVGEFVGPGESVVCTIAELETLSIEFLVPRNHRRNFAIDDSVEVVFTVSGQTAKGTVSYISPIPNGETNTFLVKTKVNNSQGLLSAGERCQLNLQPGASTQSESPADQHSMRGQ